MDIAIRAVQRRGIFPRCRRGQRRGTRSRRVGARLLLRRDAVNIDGTISDAQRGFKRLDDAGALGRRHAHPILHDFQATRRLRVDARIALAFQQFEDFLDGEILWNFHREGNQQPRIAGRLRPRLQVRVDRVGIVALYRARAAAAKKLRGTREQQFQVIGQFCHRADRGTRRAHGIGLVDGDRRRHAIDAFDLRLVHAIEKLARVRGEGFHIAALSLRIQGVEHQRGLAGTGNPGDDQQLVQRQVDVDVLEVVLARSADQDRVATQ